MFWFFVGAFVGCIVTTVLFLVFIAFMLDNWDDFFPSDGKSEDYQVGFRDGRESYLKEMIETCGSNPAPEEALAWMIHGRAGVGGGGHGP